jgi:FMN phosphatase YigB (HAD superfamily)
MVKKYLFGLLTSIFLLAYPQTVIFDLGGVLSDPDKFGVAREIGIHHFIAYMLFDLKNPNIQAIIFRTLELLETPEQKHIKAATAPDGMVLPFIMCQWQSGEITGYEIIAIACKLIKKLNKKGYFKSKREKVLIEKTIRAMFDPTILARNVNPIQQGLDLVKECAMVRNKDGTKKHKLIAFSNWDHLSFDYFLKRNRETFKYFDHIIISGHIKFIKPDPKAYDYLIQTCKLNPKMCILIDDQEVNAKAAQAYGMKTFVVKNKNSYGELRKQLIKWKVLPKNKIRMSMPNITRVPRNM